MARNQPINAAAEKQTREARALGFDMLNMSVDTAWQMLNQSLVAAQDMARWMAQVQQWNAKSVAELGEIVSSAMQEAQQARDLPTLMAVPATLVNRELQTLMSQWGQGMQQMLEAEVDLADRVRGSTSELTQRAMSGVASTEAGANRLGQAAADVTPFAPLAQLGQAQQEWMNMTQRWLASVNSSRPQSPRQSA